MTTGGRWKLFIGAAVVGVVIGLILWWDDPPEPQAIPIPSRPPLIVDPAPEGAPNVVLIGIDSLRADHLGCNGYERETSPAIDALAKEGVLFEEVIASTSWTLPSFMAILTSLSDSVHGVQRNGQRLTVDAPLLQEILQAAGYSTGGFYSGPYLHAAFGFGAGFDAYVDCTSYPEKKEEDPLTPSRETEILSYEDVTSEKVIQKASAFLEDGKEPFFLFIHLWDVHFDYTPPPPYDAMFDPDYAGDFDFSSLEFNDGIKADMDPRELRHMVALYDGEIRWTDHWIGVLMDRMREKDLLRRTLVIVTSDHGEEFFEHGKKGHQKSLHDEVLKVPLILRLPGTIPEGKRIGTQVRTIDILPTVLDIVGVSSPSPVLGQSLVPCWTGDAHVPPAISELDLGPAGPRLRSHRTSSGKLIRDLLFDRASYYDLEKDPGENHPLDPDPEAMADLREIEKVLLALKRLLPDRSSAIVPDLDPEVLDRLRSLGYVK